MAVNLLKKNSLALVALLAAGGPCTSNEMLNSSYDVSRELFAALNPPFEQQWAKDNSSRTDDKTISCRVIKTGAGDFTGLKSRRCHL